MNVRAGTLDSFPDVREVVTIIENGVTRVAYDGLDRARAHEINLDFMRTMPNFRGLLAPAGDSIDGSQTARAVSPKSPKLAKSLK